MIPRLVLALVFLAGPAMAGPVGEMHQRDTLRDAAMAPLEDLNLKQKAIPEVLLQAVADPYDVEGLERCEAVAREIGRLDAALGPDLDEAPPPDDRSRLKKVGAAVRDAGIAEVRNQTTDALPFRGWVRRLTGAARHDKKVQAAIRAGEIRRGYLKGHGMTKNCAPPAAPSWFVPKPPEPAGFSLSGLWSAIVAFVRNLLGL